MNKIKAVLFDLDGTLIDSMPAHFESWNFAVIEPAALIPLAVPCLMLEGAAELSVGHAQAGDLLVVV